MFVTIGHFLAPKPSVLLLPHPARLYWLTSASVLLWSFLAFPNFPNIDGLIDGSEFDFDASHSFGVTTIPKPSNYLFISCFLSHG